MGIKCSSSLELELGTVVSHHVVLGSEPGSSVSEVLLITEQSLEPLGKMSEVFYFCCMGLHFRPGVDRYSVSHSPLL